MSVPIDAINWVLNSVTTTSSTSSSVTVEQAVAWGATAGDQWIRDLENHFALQTITGGTGTGVRFASRELTPEEAEEHGRLDREGEYRRDRAGWRAEELLLRNLTRRQREDYQEHGRFTVKTRRGHRYLVGSARSQNVVRVNRRGKPMRVYCVTVHGVPLADSLLGQKLMLDHDEGHFLRVARQWPVRFALGVRGRSRGRMTVVEIPFLTVNGEPVAA